MLRQLLVTFLFAAFSMVAYSQQTLVFVNSPGNLEGSYDFSTTTGDWGNVPEPSSGTWTADAALGDDMVDPNSDGCTPLMNTAEMEGKIALIDRGACNFSLKAWHAQDAGAIACIIINNAGDGLVNMAPGDSASAVTIPVVFIGQSNGDAIKAELANGPVNITIGQFAFANDIGATNSDFIRNPNGVMPAAQVAALGADAGFAPGAEITNNGSNDASNVVLSVSIEHTPLGGGSTTTVHNDAITDDLLEVDSSIIIAMDNEYAADAGAGVYTVNYTIASDSTDGFDFDNTSSFDYVLSEDAYCKGSWDMANDRPYQDAAFTIAGGAAIEFISGFQMPLGEGYQLDRVQWYMSSGGPDFGTIGESQFAAYVYRWDDADEDGAVLNDEIEIVALGIVESFPDPLATEAWMDVPLLDFETLEPGYVVPADDNVYFVGVRYTGADQVFFGFDQSYDQRIYFDFLAPTLADLSYFFVDTWVDVKPDIENDAGIFTDFWASIAHSLRISQVNSVGENNPEIGSFQVFPNPTTDVLNVETNLAKNYDRVDYTIVNANGAVVSIVKREVNNNVDNATLDVSSLAAGQYFLNVNTVDGSVSKAFTVQR